MNVVDFLASVSLGRSNLVPNQDAIDFQNGAKCIPFEVTMARREGKVVTFDPVKHEWTMPNGSIVR